MTLGCRGSYVDGRDEGKKPELRVPFPYNERAPRSEYRMIGPSTSSE
jgi:hypothetical protein